MQLRSLALKFVVQGGIVYATDQRLHQLAEQFATTEFAQPINFADYEHVLTVCEMDADDQPVKVVGMCCRVVAYDFPVWRGTTPDAMDELITRTKANLDEQGLRGREVFVHVADHEDKASRCPHWKKFLRKVKAVKASRWRVKV